MSEFLPLQGGSAFEHFNQVTKWTGWSGRVMGWFGWAVQVKDEQSNQSYYIQLKEVVAELVGNQLLSAKSSDLLSRRILEIADSDNRKPLSYEKLKKFFTLYFDHQAKNPTPFKSEEGIIKEVEKIKQELSEIKHIYYSDSLKEIVRYLRPGDFLVRKYHEDNRNYICDLQNLLHREGYREAYKCSHIAIYLGEIQGSHYIAEASMPHGFEAELRRIKIDDPRFELKHKNQYLIIRNHNRDSALETARLARNYATKLLPENEKILTEDDKAVSPSYTYLEALRSLWHSSSLGFFGRQRLFKYYADYKNGIPFEYLGSKRSFFCSHFALIMTSLSEMKKSKKIQKLLKNSVPSYDHSKTGIARKVSDLWYSVKKGMWSRWMTIRYASHLNSIPTQLDALRTSPQAGVLYMTKHSHQFKVVALINHQDDYVDRIG